MKSQFSTLLFFFLVSFIIGQTQSPYLDVANELLVRKKLSSKLPDVFDDTKFNEIANKLDNIVQIQPETHIDRLNIINPEFHWCYAQTYFLSGQATKSLDHYRQYKIQTLKNTESIHPLFQKPVAELESALENQQANLAYDIYTTISTFKDMEIEPKNIQILDLQNKLNAYNELSASPIYIKTDGIIGTETKSAIYDFEENNPYFISQGKIENAALQNIAKYKHDRQDGNQ